MDISLFAKIDSRCDDFERSWKLAIENNSDPPKIADFLGQGTELNKRLRLALVCIDTDYRKIAGLEPHRSVYRELNLSEEEVAQFRDEMNSLQPLPDVKHDGAVDQDDDEQPTIVPTRSKSQRTQAPASSSSTITQIGDYEIGDYEIIEEIARGGMGVVYKARQKKLNRLCALKMILSGQFAGEEELQRFYVEAEAAANLQHPGIVPVFEVGEISGQHFYSMGYVEGKSLADRIVEGPMTPIESATTTRKISEAIAHAHELNVIHRDLKPANVLIDKDGTPKVTDFGLAKKTAGESDLTATGQILGTPSYMPPEQAAGQLDQVDEQSDLYSLGAILYCLITGRPPFQAANPMDVLFQVLEEVPVSPTKLNPAIPRDLETICLKCLSKEKSKRYQTVQELIDELKRFENGESILARPASRVEKVIRWCRRKPAAAISAGLAMLLLLSLSIAGPWIALQQSRIADQQTRFGQEQRELREVADNARENEESAKDLATQAKNEIEKTVYARTISLAYEEWKSNDVARAESLLDQTDPKLRDWEYSYTKQLCNSESQSLMGMQNNAAAVVMLDDGIHIAAAEEPSPNSATFVWNWKTGALIKKHAITGLAFSHDGRLFAALVSPRTGPNISSGERIGIFETLTGKKLVEFIPHARFTVSVAFSPDGTKLATCGNDSKVCVWDVQTGKRLVSITERKRKKTHPIFWSEDNQWMSWKLINGKIQIYDASTGKLVRSLDDPLFRNDTIHVALHRGKGILASGNFGVIHLFEIESGKKIGSIFGHQNAVTGLKFIDEGNRLVTIGGDMTVRCWEIETRKELISFRGHKPGFNFGIATLAVASDEKWIVSAGYDKTIQVWSIQNLLASDQSVTDTGVFLPSPNQEANFLYEGSKSVFSFEVSRDGKLAAAAGADKNVRIYDTATRKVVRTFGNHQQSVGAVAFHPEKNWVASGSGGINARDGGQILVWDAETGETKHEFKINGPVSGLRFAKQGKRLVATSGSQVVTSGEIASFNLETNEKESGDRIDSVIGIALSPDESKLAVVTLQGMVMYDLVQDKFLWNKRETEAPPFSVAFSPDSKTLAVGKRTSQVGVFDVASGDRLWHEIGHFGVVTGLAFFNEGRRIVSVGNDKTTKIWNAESGDVLLALRDDGFEKFGVEVHPDDKTLYIYGEAPYVTIRGHEQELGDAGETEYTTLFSDDFERDEIGNDWTIPYGDWSIENGALRGRLVQVPSIPNYVSSTISPKQFLPSYVEVEYDIWSETPMFFQTTFTDLEARNTMSSLYIGVPVSFVNAGRQGAAVSIWTNGVNDFNHSTDRGFRFRAGKKYRVKTIHEDGILKVFCDGEFITERKVPNGFLLTATTLSAAFAPPGSEFFIDNVVVRSKNNERFRNEVMAITREYELFQTLKSKTLVEFALQRDVELDPAIKQLALKAAEYRVETFASRQEVFGAHLAVGNLSSERYKDIEAVIQNSSDYPDEFLRKSFLAACSFRLAEYSKAIELAIESDKEYLKLNGSKNAVNAAILALAHFKLGNLDKTKEYLAGFRELRRSPVWNSAAGYSSKPTALAGDGWAGVIDAEIDPTIRQAVFELAEDEAEILDLTFRPHQDAELFFQTKEYFDSYTDDATIIRGRTATPNALDWKVPVKDWRASEAIWYQGESPVSTTFIRDFVDLKIDQNEAVLEAIVCQGFSFASWRLHQIFKLRKTDAGWKIFERREAIVQRLLGANTVLDDSDWEEMDNKVEGAKKDFDRNSLRQVIELGVAYDMALRLPEAYQLLKETANDDSIKKTGAFAPGFWHALSMYSWQVGDAGTMKSAIEQSFKLEVNQEGPSYFGAASAQVNLPASYKDYGNQIRMKVPSHFKEGDLRNARMMGEPVAYYYCNNRSVFLVNREKKTFASREEFEKSFYRDFVVKLVGGLKAQCYRKRVFKLGKYDAFDLIIEGNGNGLTIQPTTAAVGKGTILRLVGIRRENDLVIMVVCSFANEFDFRNSAFQVILENAKFD